MTNNFGDYVRGLRKNKKFTLLDLSHKTGITQAYLSQIETGKRPVPNVEILNKLRTALDANIMEFMNAAGLVPHVETLSAAFGFDKLPGGDYSDLYTLLDRTDLDLYYKTNKISKDDRLFLKLLLEKIFSHA